MKILVPTDFSDNARNAFDFAKEIAKKNHGTITLLYAYYNVYDFAAQSSSIIIQIEETARQAMEEISDERSKGCEVNYRIVQDSVATAVTSTAYKENYDLIVMGTQGESGIRKALMGSNTVHVIKDSKTPVLVVPFASSFDTIKEVVVSVDWETIDQKDLEKLFRISRSWKMPIWTVNVKTNGNRGSAGPHPELMSFLEEHLPGMEHHSITATDIYEGIHKYLQDRSQCLLVMFSKHKPFFERLLAKGNIEKMAFHTHVPLLVLN
ncbi:MAG TPA: universal stress protein [Aequorivita sp.]|nr:universal stress protein [Aequorivita sp.]